MSIRVVKQTQNRYAAMDSENNIIAVGPTYISARDKAYSRLKIIA